MAVLDRYLEALRMPGAQAITFKSGLPVEILANNEVRTISSAVPTADQLVSILQEVLPADFRMQGTAPKDYPYTSPLGVVKITLTINPNGVVARIMPWQGPPPPPPAGPPPGPPAGPPAATPAARPPVVVGKASTPPRNRESNAGTKKPAHMDDLFNPMLDVNASDLHLKTGKQPQIRLHGEMEGLEGFAPLNQEELHKLIWQIMPERNKPEFDETHDTDFAYEMDRARMRCNVFKDIVGVGAVFRQIPTKIQTARELGVPPAVIKLCEMPKGLILVTGPTGSGKSTTLAALIDYVNETRTDHIITIEDPVEFVHKDKKSHINQREVGPDTVSFKAALRAALREDPDVVLIGELRDLETMAIAIETAETGHLVFATLHTNTAASTVDRLIDQFPADRQAQIRSMLSESLIGVVSQTLCKKREGGRIAALEVLLVTSAIANLIREGKVFQIPSTMQVSRGLGMQTMNDALLDLVKSRAIDSDVAYAASISKKEMGVALTRAGFRGSWTDEKKDLN